jgi:hypothetical protein
MIAIEKALAPDKPDVAQVTAMVNEVMRLSRGSRRGCEGRQGAPVGNRKIFVRPLRSVEVVSGATVPNRSSASLRSTR